jgi:hypothetical protein
MKRIRRYLQAGRFSGIKYHFNLKTFKAMLMRTIRKSDFLLILICLFSGILLQAQTVKNVSVGLIRDDERHKIDILVNGTLFTSYRYGDNFEKPILFPVIAADGKVITRGFPLEPRAGERMDHPHQVGIWFNYGNVNGLDFWNNSSAIPAEKKDSYGHIVLQQIVRTVSGKKGILEVIAKWEDNKGNVLLTEQTKYIFSGDANSRTIDHISTLTAVNGSVTIGDSKEGMFAIRVDRAFEMPSDESLIFTDEKGNPATIKAMNNKGVNGMYTSSSGLKGDAVWGTRNEWVLLRGVKDNDIITMGIFDNPENPGFPAYAHARGYGLFSLNNFGQNSYDPKLAPDIYKLDKGQSVTLRHRFYVLSGSELTHDKAAEIFEEFKAAYHN